MISGTAGGMKANMGMLLHPGWFSMKTAWIVFFALFLPVGASVTGPSR